MNGIPGEMRHGICCRCCSLESQKKVDTICNRSKNRILSTYTVRKTAAVFLTIVLMLVNAFCVFGQSQTDVRETVIFSSKERGYKDPGTETRTFELQRTGEITVSGTQFFYVKAETDDQDQLIVSMSLRPGLDEGKYEEYVEVSVADDKVYSAMLIFEVVEIKWPKMITELNIEFQEIEAGYVCTGLYKTDLIDYTGDSEAVCIWTCVDDDRKLRNGVDFFESGKTYQVTIGPFVGDGRYYFEDVFSASVNGKNADISMNSGDKKCTVVCKFGPLKEKTVYIPKVSLEIRPPAEGTTQFPRISVLGGKGYSVSTEPGALKVFTKIGTSTTRIVEGEIFRSDLRYVAEIRLMTDKNDYRFSEECTAEVNGETAEVVLNEDGTCTVKCEFSPEENRKADGEELPRKQMMTLLTAAVCILIATFIALVLLGKD